MRKIDAIQQPFYHLRFVISVSNNEVAIPRKDLSN